MSELLELLRDTSTLNGGNADFIEYLYEQYLNNPDSVSESWRQRFDKIHQFAGRETAHSPIVEHFAQQHSASYNNLSSIQKLTHENYKKHTAVSRLINHYRVGGHQIAKNNPLETPPKTKVDLEPGYYGLSDQDMNTVFETGSLYGVNKQPLKDIIAALKEIYCGSIGTEYMHIVDNNIKQWIKTRLENTRANQHFKPSQKQWVLKQLTAAEGIEKYLHTKFVGQKRFSLEGGESLIPLLDNLIQRSGERNATEVVIGMAHRGRLNVLVNILGKSPASLFDEFSGSPIPTTPGVSSGDVKYHMGFSSNIATPGGPLHLTLAFNPSHLEIINPVVEGSVKARQDRYGQGGDNTILPILIHGDAAFAGQGIVMETLNMAETRAYSTGGTVHIVINNQIGFTTSHPFDARSTLYCTDVANMVQIPVFHVNGDDPEAVLFVTQLALDFRMTFHKDVVIDMICYRKRGHNEADEPATTQPMMYKKINQHKSVREIYAQKLIKEGVISAEDAEKLQQDYIQLLEEGKNVARPMLSDEVYSYSAQWQQFLNRQWDIPCKTSASIDAIRFCSEQLLRLPAEFELHPRVAKIMDNRRKMTAGAQPLDWGYAEIMAYATLLNEKYNIRLTGQDVGRGTFFHRHAILSNQINGNPYIPLKHLSADQGRPQVFNSLLSEAGVLGFEYGYSTTTPNTLVIWEAQFGDFANGAQVLIDQFISSGESKWGRLSGLVMLLPHGFEGQGPEHSSARLERYLQLCAEHNIQVCNPTTPSQIFHLLRRQILRQYRKPLIVMSPKSLLRHKLAVSTLEDLTEGEFLPVIPEQDDIPYQQVTRLVLCSGKVYYDLLEKRRKDNAQHIAIIRIEQLYPFPDQLYQQEIEKYPNITELIWCQEEPKNQGAWYQSKHHFSAGIDSRLKLTYAGRPASASPAVGHFATHIKQQKAVVESALYGIPTGENYDN